MATVTETATFAPVVQLWATPMRPDNTPVTPGAPIGRVTWFASKVTAAKDAGNVVELAIAVTMPLRQFAYRLMNIQWQAQITDPGAVADMNDWSDAGFLTVPTSDETITYNLSKSSSSLQATITNLFTTEMYTPSSGETVSVKGVPQQFRDPFVPLSPLIFRTTNISGNASEAMSWFSHMWAYIYTIEQYEQHALWTAAPIGDG